MKNTNLISEQEKIELIKILKSFDKNYRLDKENYILNTLKEQLPEKSEEELIKIKDEFQEKLNILDENKKAFDKHRNQGRSRESFIEKSLEKATKNLTQDEKIEFEKDVFETLNKNNCIIQENLQNNILQNNSQYLNNIDSTLNISNINMQNTVHTKSGAINKNPRLDGFIAEQHHVNTFNVNATAKGSKYRAYVLEAGESGFAKNSVDIVIKDTSTGKTVRRYQSKYCKDVQATTRALKHGNYRGQRKLVADGQQEHIKGATNIIQSPDGVSSNPLSKSQAESLRDKSQNSNLKSLNIDYKTISNKDLTLGITKEACVNGLYGGLATAGLIALEQMSNGDTDVEEIVKTGVISGLDTTAKSSLAGALKVGVEKEVIKFIPKGTSSGGYLGMACIAIDGVKVLSQIGSGELTLGEGMEKIQDKTCSTVGAMLCYEEGVTIGATIGTALGPVGSAVGGVIGGFVASVAGSTIGKAVSTGIKTVAKGVGKVISKGVEIVKDVVSTVGSVISSVVSGIGSFVSSLFSWW